MKKYNFFSQKFKNAEPEIFNALRKTKDRELFLIVSLVVLTVSAFILQLFLPIGLKISLLVSALWLIMLIVSSLIFPPFIVASKAFSKSHIKKTVGFFLALNMIFLCSIVVMAYSLTPFFLGGLKLFNEG